MQDKQIITILTQALALIKANPEHWNQQFWHCGSTHCLAGFCDIVADGAGQGVPLAELDYPRNISEFAELNPKLAYLFRESRDLAYISREIAHLQATQVITGYDKDGYNRQGYDKEGYDKDGYDGQGYDKKGYDKDGYDYDGCDKNGYSGRDYDKEDYS